MAYGINQFLVTVQGDTGNADAWINTWCFRDVAGAQDPQDAVDILHAFYVELEPTQSAAYTHLSAQIKALQTGFVVEADWAPGQGNEAAVILPSQLAIRVSLNDDAGVGGGPFLPGWSNAAITAGGAVLPATVTDIVDGLENMRDSLGTNGWALAINRPTLEVITNVSRARVGTRFDVIRRRANEQPESYSVVTF